MNWPWISREAFDIALSAERKRADSERENAMYLRRELSDLTAKYHMLRLQGAVSEQPAPVTREPAEIDPCVAAIRERSRGNPRLRSTMLAQLARDRTAQKDDADILREIEQGVRMDGIPA